jgi:dihydropteroate synthase
VTAGGTPHVRVEDATLVAAGGPARFVVTHLDRATEVMDAVASAGGSASVVDGRLHVVAKPSQVIYAAGRTGGADLAEPLRAAVDAAVAAWGAPAPDLLTAAGVLRCSERPVVMGVLNVTPDSFSDGGSFLDDDAHPGPAVRHAEALLEAGADVIDVGGESTRPGADPVDEEEELRRVLPVVESLSDAGAIVSVDTTKARVARAAVEAGAAIVNDVSAGVLDGLMLRTVAELQVPYVVMHMQGTPRTMQRDPRYGDVVAEVHDFLADQLGRLEAMGIARDHLVVDPGIGFGKTVQHNLELLRRVREFTSLGRPVLIGASRKSFIGHTTGEMDPLHRVAGSVAAAALAVAAGASIVRVHDVAETVQAVVLARAVARGPAGTG